MVHVFTKEHYILPQEKNKILFYIFASCGNNFHVVFKSEPDRYVKQWLTSHNQLHSQLLKTHQLFPIFTHLNSIPTNNTTPTTSYSYTVITSTVLTRQHSVQRRASCTHPVLFPRWSASPPHAWWRSEARRRRGSAADRGSSRRRWRGRRSRGSPSFLNRLMIRQLQD